MLQVDAPSAGAAKVTVPDGRIHHWIGAAFVQNATVEGVLRKLRDGAGRDPDRRTEVVDSRLLSRDGDRSRVFLKLRSGYKAHGHLQHRAPTSCTARWMTVARRAEAWPPRLRSWLTRGLPRKERNRPDRIRVPVAAQRVLAVRAGEQRRAHRVRIGQPQSGVPALLRLFITGIVEGIARDSLDRTLVSLRKRLSG